MINNLEFTPRFLRRGIRILDHSERKLFVKICRGQESACGEKACALFEKFRHLKEQKINVSKKDSSISFYSQLKKRITWLLSTIAFKLGYLTKKKTIELVRASLQKNSSLIKEKKISQSELQKILSKERRKNPTGRIELGKILQERGYSLTLSNLVFEGPLLFLRIDLNGIKFEGCTFKNVSFVNSEIKGSDFIYCEMREVMFTKTTIDQVTFSSCEILGSSFEDAIIRDSSFRKVTLFGTHFLQAKVERSFFFESNLQDAVFFKTFENFISDEKSTRTKQMTRPTAVLLVDPENRGITVPKAFIKIDRSANLIPLRIGIKPQNVEENRVTEEFEEALDLAKQTSSEDSIPQKLIEVIKENPNKFASLAAILEKTQILGEEVSGIFLPGGEDVPPSLYGQEAQKDTHWGEDYRRSILEFGLINEAFIKGIPLMGICRGFQITNVFFGARLKQHVNGQKGIQTFDKPQIYSGMYQDVLKHRIKSPVFHHQAVMQAENPNIRHLDSSITYHGMIKGSEVKYPSSVPMILLQFHPEFYHARTAYSMQRELVDRALNLKMSRSNEKFWQMFSESSGAYCQKKRVLEGIKSVQLRRLVIPRRFTLQQEEERSLFSER